MGMNPTREDYEHAARAAGITGDWVDGYGFRIQCPIYGFRFWSPYCSSSDAFRLMTACGLSVKCKSNSVQVCVPHGNWMTFFHNDDNPEEVARHAIFWAAVTVGKQMKEV